MGKKNRSDPQRPDMSGQNRQPGMPAPGMSRDDDTDMHATFSDGMAQNGAASAQQGTATQARQQAEKAADKTTTMRDKGKNLGGKNAG
ncbi:hypothetical protein AB0M43_00725 [Longispora sp. NPDC051575]|uniref:hypothetical protein n=1 Tax=Longispora sp. NPDC051575 TaxID=3154943 RepID=UPI00343CF4D2